MKRLPPHHMKVHTLGKKRLAPYHMKVKFRAVKNYGQLWAINLLIKLMLFLALQ